MIRRRIPLGRLDVRLFVSYVVVVAAGAAALLVTARLLAPALFDRRVARLGRGYGRGPGMGQGGGGLLHGAFLSALNSALVVALIVSVVVAVIVAALVARRILRPLDAVRAATRRLATGHYQPVPLPREPELAALAADVNSLAASLADTEQRRAQLIAEVAHELRTPLTTVEGYVEGMLDGVFAADEETLAAVADEVSRLKRLVGDIGALSRADERAFELHLRPTDVAALATAVAERLRPQFADKDVELRVATEPAIAQVDPDRVAQVVTNLLGNALTYTPKGGLVSLDVQADAADAVVTVSDSGVGLAAEELERVFDRFYRVAAPERPQGGSGIGLTIAHSIARSHGGNIVATSAGRGQGAAFTLRLPLARRPHDGGGQRLTSS